MRLFLDIDVRIRAIFLSSSAVLCNSLRSSNRTLLLTTQDVRPDISHIALQKLLQNIIFSESPNLSFSLVP